MNRIAAALVLCIGVFASAFGVNPSPARSETVTHEYLGLDVTGNLELAPDKSLAANGVILIVHGSLSHHRMEVIAALQANLKARGLNSLAITLSLGINRRQGMFDCKLEHDHRHGDAADEIIAWVEWLQGKGAASVTVLGHSRGASQTALALVERADVGVARMILAAPLYQGYAEIAERYQQEAGQPLAPLLARARRMIEDGEGDTLLDVPGFLYCRPARVTAAAFHDYYAADPQQDVLKLMAQINTPTLLVLAGDDKIVPTLATAVFEAQKSNWRGRRVSVVTVEGADHFFRDLFGEDLADHVAAFVGKR